MATAKLVPGKPTVTIEGLSYEAAQAIKAWLLYSVTGNGEPHKELEAIAELSAFRQIKLPDCLGELGLRFLGVGSTYPLDDDDLPF